MLVSPTAERNKETILEVLADYVDDTSSAFGLELGSGTGQHVVHFAQALPTVTWQPSEISLASQQSISAYIRATRVTNVREPLPIDVSQPWEQWAGLVRGCCDFIIIINVLHMTDQGLEGMFKGIGQLLKPGGICLAYGPFAINGIIIPECNVQLDRTLQARNPEWGLRDVEELRQLANINALRLERMVRGKRPARNFAGSNEINLRKALPVSLTSAISPTGFHVACSHPFSSLVQLSVCFYPQLEMPEYTKCLIFRRREL
ncbi:methyltransferase-like 26 B [Elgaria multicarinata webbii]|uniref:methyltransferase-like 26 B n=1 Tax=Elgaria multicarinata webbii TaxID=159646 RepID=UPI002FCD611E